MSSPRRQTPRGAGRNAGGGAGGSSSQPEDTNPNTPRPAPRPSSHLASSPLLYNSSPAPAGRPPVSSPLRQMSNSQSTGPGAGAGPGPGPIPVPSSPFGPLADESQSQDRVAGGDRTPRARPQQGNLGTSSPVRYDLSSSPGRRRQDRTELRSESSTLFIRHDGPDGPRSSRRGDIDSDSLMRTPRPANRIILDGDGRVVGHHPSGRRGGGRAPATNATSEADTPAGAEPEDDEGGLVWGTTISIDDTMASFKNFIRSFSKKYRMYRDGLSDAEVAAAPDSDARVYVEALETMLLLGGTKFYLDVQDLLLYPPTRKMYHQVLAYPNEIISCMDQCVKDMMMELAIAEKIRSSGGATQNQQQQHHQQQQPHFSSQSSVSPFPSSDTPTPAVGAATPGTPRAVADRSQPSLEDQVSQSDYFVRPYNLEKTINLRDLDPADMDQLISIKGLVIRTTPVIPDMKEGFFRCNVCNHSVVVGVDRGRIDEPTECPRRMCGSKNSMQIVHNRCVFEDKQIVKLQETPDAVPAGQTPHSVSIWAYNELVDFCKAGDRVRVTGIFKACPVRVNPRQRTVKTVHKTYVDSVHIQKVDRRRVGVDPAVLVVEGEEQEQEVERQLQGRQQAAEEDEDGEGGGGGGNHLAETRTVSAEDEARIRSTAARDDLYELLARSLAPSIHEMDDVKKGILLQLFGGTNKTFRKGGSPRYRGDVNVLLCGDPSTSKSQILQYVHKIAPRGVYTSGKGSSAVGLTAYVARDPESRQLVLESGALVLSDGGVCCIDEFDKMSDATRSVLHEVMEQQTVSVAKAGIITTLNARTSILASANPIGSRYNPDLPVPQNIDLPPTLLSRFDLVYLILDRVNERADARLARHLLSLYLEDVPEAGKGGPGGGNEILPVEFLTLYISFARSRVHPTLSDEAAKALVAAYVDMRRIGQQDARAAERRITATTRQLESMIRLSEAHAKMRLSVTVTGADVEEAVRLIRSALQTAATDAQGRIDMSLLTEGTSVAERRRREDLKEAVVRVLDEMTAGGQPARWGEVTRRLGEAAGVGGGGVDQADFAEAMRALEAEGRATVSGDGGRRSIRRVTGL